MVTWNFDWFEYSRTFTCFGVVGYDNYRFSVRVGSLRFTNESMNYAVSQAKRQKQM